MTMATVGLPTTTGNVTFSGIVVPPAGSAVPQFRLRFTTGVVSRTIMVSSNPFTVELPPGEYSVSVTNLPEGYVVRSIADGSNDLLKQSLKVVAAPSQNSTPRITVTLRTP
jgi:hypothetical protein